MVMAAIFVLLHTNEWWYKCTNLHRVINQRYFLKTRKKSVSPLFDKMKQLWCRKSVYVFIFVIHFMWST